MVSNFGEIETGFNNDKTHHNPVKVGIDRQRTCPFLTLYCLYRFEKPV